MTNNDLNYSFKNHYYVRSIPMTLMTIVWNLMSLSISLWSRLLISFIKLHVSKLATINNKVMAATKRYSNQRGFSSLIRSIKLSVLFIIVMLIVSMPKSNRLEIFRESRQIHKTFLFSFLPVSSRIHYFILEMPIRLK